MFPNPGVSLKGLLELMHAKLVRSEIGLPFCEVVNVFESYDLANVFPERILNPAGKGAMFARASPRPR